MNTHIQMISVGFNVQLNQFRSGMNQASAATGQMKSRMLKALEAIDQAVTKTAIALGRIFVNVAKDSAEAGFSLIKLKDNALLAFTKFSGDAAKARKHLADLQDFAAKTPFELPGLVDASIKLQNAGVAAEKVIPTLTSIGDAVANFGGGSEAIEGVTRQLTQMLGQAKFSAEDLNIINDHGVQGWKALADTMGVTVTEAKKHVADGTVSTEKYFDAFIAQLGHRVKGTMEAQSGSLSGLISTLKDEYARASATIWEPLYRGATDFVNWAMNGGLSLGDTVDSLKESVQQISDDIFSFLRENGQSIVDGLSAAFVSAAEGLANFLSLVREVSPHVMTLAKTIGGWVAAAADWLAKSPKVVASLLGLKVLLMTGLPQALLKSTGLVGGLHAVVLLAAAAFALWLYNSNADVKKLNEELARSKKLTKDLQDINDKKRQRTLDDLSKIEDPEKRRQATQAELDRAQREKDQTDRNVGAQRAALEKKKSETWFWDSTITADQANLDANEKIAEARQADVDALTQALKALDAPPPELPLAPVGPPEDEKGPANRERRVREHADRAVEKSDPLLKGYAEISKFIHSGASSEEIKDFVSATEGMTPDLAELIGDTIARIQEDKGLTPEQKTEQIGQAIQGPLRQANSAVESKDRAEKTENDTFNAMHTASENLPLEQVNAFNAELEALRQRYIALGLTDQEYQRGLDEIKDKIRNAVENTNALRDAEERIGNLRAEGIAPQFEASFAALNLQLETGAITVHEYKNAVANLEQQIRASQEASDSFRKIMGGTFGQTFGANSQAAMQLQNRFRQLHTAMEKGAIGIDDFKDEIKKLETQAEKAAEAEKQKRLIQGDFAGAGLDPQKAVMDKMASIQQGKFDETVDKIANQLLGTGKKFDEAGDAAQDFASTLPSQQEAASAWEKISNFIASIDGQRQLILNNIALMRQSLQITEDALSRQDLQRKIDDLIRQLQVLDQQQANLPTFVADRGDLEFKDPGLSGGGGSGGGSARGSVHITLPNVNRFGQAEAELIVNTIEREMSRRGRRL